MDVSNGNIFHSNPVGARVWAKVQAGLPLPGIVDEISTEFNAPRERVEADVHEYLYSLKAKGLVVER